MFSSFIPPVFGVRSPNHFHFTTGGLLFQLEAKALWLPPTQSVVYLADSNKNGAVTDSGDSSDLHRKKADKSTKNAELSTFCGGGEGSRTPVRKPIHTTFSGRRRFEDLPDAVLTDKNHIRQPVYA